MVEQANEKIVEIVGIVTDLSPTEIKYWVSERREIVVVPRDQTTVETECVIGDWIRVFFDESKCAEDRRYTVKKPTAAMPEVQSVDKKITMHINFIPMNEYLYPKSAVEKNLRMCHTLELGNVPLVFANRFELYCAYVGSAVLSLDKDAAEIRLERLYSTPWLIAKDDKNAPSNEEIFRKRLQRANALIVRRQSQRLLQAYSQQHGLIHLSVAAGREPLDVGDFIGFYMAEIFEKDVKRRIGLAARKIPSAYQAIVSGGVVEVIHEVTTGSLPAYNEVYTVSKLGNVRDSHAVVVSRPNCTLKVRSRCTLNDVGVNFYIIAVVHDENQAPLSPSLKPTATAVPTVGKKTTPAGGSHRPTAFATRINTAYHTPERPSLISRRPKPDLRDGMIASEAVVLAELPNDYYSVYSNDRAIFRHHVTRLSAKEMELRPAVGDFLEVIQRCIGSPASRRYAIDWVGKKEVQPFDIRFTDDNTLNIRVPASITGGFSATLYHNFFGVIRNTDERIQLPDDETTGRKLVHLWIHKIRERYDMNWAIADDPDPVIETKSPILIDKTPAPIEKPRTIRYIGAKYSTIDDQSINTGFVKASATVRQSAPLGRAAGRQTSTPSPSTGQASNRKSPVGRPWGRPYTPQQKKPGEAPNANLERITKNYEEFFLERPGPLPAFLRREEPPRPAPESAPSPEDNYSASRLEPTEETDEGHKSTIYQLRRVPTPTEEEFCALYAMNGVVVSVVTNGVYVYTRDNPDKEALLTNDIMDVNVKHGDWINFEARWHHDKYIVVSYVKRPPICQTRCVRNTVELLIPDALVPPFYGAIDNDVDAHSVSSSFLTTITDPRRLLSEKLRGCYVEAWALRGRSNNPDSNTTINWQLTRIERVLNR